MLIDVLDLLLDSDWYMEQSFVFTYKLYNGWIEIISRGVFTFVTFVNIVKGRHTLSAQSSGDSYSLVILYY